MQAAYLPRGCMQSEELFGCYERLTNVSLKAVVLNSTQYISVIFFLHIHFDVNEILLVGAVKILRYLLGENFGYFCVIYFFMLICS